MFGQFAKSCHRFILRPAPFRQHFCTLSDHRQFCQNISKQNVNRAGNRETKRRQIFTSPAQFYEKSLQHVRRPANPNIVRVEKTLTMMVKFIKALKLFKNTQI